MNKSLLLISAMVAMALGFMQEVAEATCTDCDSSEENVLMQHTRRHGKQHKTSSSKNEHSCYLAIKEAQTAWANAILKVTEEYPNGPFIEAAETAIHDLYGYDIGTVMFKPTKAKEVPFRHTPSGALSYFVGYEALQNAGQEGIEEDGGFAINDGYGWSKVEINNSDISCVGDFALAHGYYYFTNKTDETKVAGVEYSWVYKKVDGKLKIIVHHSSIPYPEEVEAPATTAAPALTTAAPALMEEGIARPRRGRSQRGYHEYKPRPDCNKAIFATQEAWKHAILSISDTYQDNNENDDYIQVAEDQINELYGYDIGPVLFKPTKAVEKPFRPTLIGALSYFVGYDAIKPDGSPEDGGFAINNGVGWSKVRIENDKTSCMGDYVFAQGYYYFTPKGAENEVAVEYSWVYKWMENGKMKIILHHSSVPYNP